MGLLLVFLIPKMFFLILFAVYSPWELNHGDAAGTLRPCGELIICILSLALTTPFFFPAALFLIEVSRFLAMVVGFDQVLVGVKMEHGVSSEMTHIWQGRWPHFAFARSSLNLRLGPLSFSHFLSPSYSSHTFTHAL